MYRRTLSMFVDLRCWVFADGIMKGSLSSQYLPFIPVWMASLLHKMLLYFERFATEYYRVPLLPLSCSISTEWMPSRAFHLPCEGFRLILCRLVAWLSFALTRTNCVHREYRPRPTRSASSDLPRPTQSCRKEKPKQRYTCP